MGFEQLYQSWASFAPRQVSDYGSVFTQPGALTAALNWYRANFATREQREEAFAPFDVSTPTLTLWGNRDLYIGRPATVRERGFMRGPYRFAELDAGHFLLHEAADVCRAEIVAHVKAHPITERARRQQSGSSGSM
jgi:pimeloyl-ACP methyl ester carboxylesterase